MSRRSVLHLSPGPRDGTSQRARRPAALDPAYARIDERTSADLLRFARAYAEQLRFFEHEARPGGVRTWASFASRADVSIADMAAYLAEPERFTGERARWLGRPHFALLLTFVELLGHARDHLNGFTRRHLDYYYRELLQMAPEAPVADRAAVIFSLRPGVTGVRLPAGTELWAGKDSAGVERIYRTERELVVNRAQVAQLSSVFVDRRVTGISDVRANRSLSASRALEEMLALALGSPAPGDPVPKWEGKHEVNHGFLTGLRGVLDFVRSSLFLEHHELRALMRLVRRRADDEDAEWSEINRLMGVARPANPRDFQANLRAVGLPERSDPHDLYAHRTDPDVRVFIDTYLKSGYKNFVLLMQIKLRIDVDWAEINRLLERAGRRQRGVPDWSLPHDAPPTGFEENLALALEGRWPPPWPEGTRGINDYDVLLRRLEEHLAMPVERLEALVAFAEQIDGHPRSKDFDWSAVDRILADAAQRAEHAARCARLAEVRAGRKGAGAFDAEVSFVLGEPAPIAWEQARPRLAPYLDGEQLGLLDQFRDTLVARRKPRVVFARSRLLAQFRDTLVNGKPLAGFDWTDADRLFELAWRGIQKPPPVAQRVEVRNVYAYEDATQVKDNPAAPGWKPFGQRPIDPDSKQPRGAALGWALHSPLLALSEGERTLTVTLGLRPDGFEPSHLSAALIPRPEDRTDARLISALKEALAVEVSTAKGWIAPGPVEVKLAKGTPEDNYWTLASLPRASNENGPALQLRMTIGAGRDPLAPPPGEAPGWPALRLSLRPDFREGEWHTAIDAFAPLVLAAVHVKVEVSRLRALSLQREDRRLDPYKPFEPFGSQPVVGARLYLAHPELTRARLDSLQFDIEWMGLPKRPLKDHYVNYGLANDSGVFKANVTLVDRNVERTLAEGLPLFHDQGGKTQPTQSLKIAKRLPELVHEARGDLAPAGDIRMASRHLRIELTPVDFGHGSYASLAAARSRELAVDIAKGADKVKEADAYRVDPPYTPTIKQLTASYATSLELDPGAPSADHQLLHVHPFGACRIDPERPSLLPRYDAAGELSIGVRDLSPPQHLSLLVQFSEGTADPDAERPPLTWSYLNGDRFEELPSTGILSDTTQGLINSGIVELALPSAAPGGRLPAGLYWLRVSIPRERRSVCDIISIRAQAVSVRFDDRGNAAAHYEQPLPAGSIQRLVLPDAGIAKVEQPYNSSGGKAAEDPERLDTRVSERLRHKARALTAWDYERLVLQRFPRINKVKCLPGDGAVDVIVVPDVRELHPHDRLAPRAPANLLAAIQDYLAERAPAAARIRVRNPRYVSVQVRLGVRFREGIDEGVAQRLLNDELVRFLAPWAFDDGAEVVIGRRIYASSILDFADRHESVDFVAEIKLFRSLDGVNFELVEADDAADGYHVEVDQPDQVLVPATRHYFDIISDTGHEVMSFTGINYTRLELDFIVG